MSAIPYERAVAEDLNLGDGAVDVTMPAGGLASGSKIGVHTFLPKIYSIRDLGASNDGLTDATALIQARLDALPANEQIFLIAPPGTFLVTDTLTIRASSVNFLGAGQGATTIKFRPTAAKACFKYVKNGGVTIEKNRLSGFTFDASGETTHQKIAIDLVDIGEFDISDIHIKNWSNAAKTCIGLQIAGRQLSEFKRLTVDTDNPFHLKVCPNTSVVAIDHMVFHDIYTIADPSQPHFKIDDGVFLTNVTWSGYQAWAKGSYGIYWSDTTSVSPSYNVKIENARYEQSVNATGYMLYLKPNQFSYALDINNVYSDSLHKGFYIRNFRSGAFTQSSYFGVTEALNVDSSCGFAIAHNFFNLTNATISAAGFAGIWFNNDTSGSNIATSRLGLGIANPSNQVALPNNKGLAFVNAAGNAEIVAMILDAINHLQLSPAGGATEIFGTLAVGGQLPTNNNPVTIPNNKGYAGLDTAGVNSVQLIKLTPATDLVMISPEGKDIVWGKPVVALGGGAAPTVGTIGGSGPAGAAQVGWIRVVNSAGAACFLPYWQ